jgi:hypothetical protein
MADLAETLSSWLAEAQIAEARLTPEQHTLLQAVFRFRQAQGTDYYSTRLLSHFLLHCDCGLKVAAIARLLALSRPTASRQQGLSSKEAIRQAHHRMDGRPYGKLLPRYAGAVAQFLFSHPDASRADLIDCVSPPTGQEPVPTPAAAATGRTPRPTFSVGSGQPVPPTAPPFSRPARGTPVPSS